MRLPSSDHVTSWVCVLSTRVPPSYLVVTFAGTPSCARRPHSPASFGLQLLGQPVRSYTRMSTPSSGTPLLKVTEAKTRSALFGSRHSVM